MRRCHRSATSAATSPPAGGGPDQPKPGSDGTITSKASDGSPSWAAGSLRGPRRWRYSRQEPGQPWVSISGHGSGPRPGTRTACTVRPPMSKRRSPPERRCEPAAPTTGPGYGTPGPRGFPRRRAGPGLATRAPPRAGGPPRRRDKQPGRERRQQARPPAPGPPRWPPGDVCDRRSDGDGEVDDDAAVPQRLLPRRAAAGAVVRCGGLCSFDQG
jgi:hypothetical protein